MPIYRDRWFGTPVGAALLVGALAGGVMVAHSAVIQSLLAHMESTGKSFAWILALVSMFFTFIYFSILCAAPGICQRSVPGLLLGTAVGFLAAIMSVLSNLAIQFVLMWASSAIFLIQILSALVGFIGAVLVAFATARLYAVPAVQWKCTCIGALSFIVVIGFWMLVTTFSGSGGTSQTYASSEISVTLHTITAFLLVVPPALIVERHMAQAQGGGKGEGGKEEVGSD